MRIKNKIDVIITALFMIGLIIFSFLGNCDKEKIMLFVGVCIAILGTTIILKSRKR